MARGVRHRSRTDGDRCLTLPGRRRRLVQPQGPGLAAVDHAGGRLLHRLPISPQAQHGHHDDEAVHHEAHVGQAAQQFGQQGEHPGAQHGGDGIADAAEQGLRGPDLDPPLSGLLQQHEAAFQSSGKRSTGTFSDPPHTWRADTRPGLAQPADANPGGGVTKAEIHSAAARKLFRQTEPPHSSTSGEKP